MLDSVLEHLEAKPATVGAFFDLDGTLAQIELDPTAVRPLDGVEARLHELAAHLGIVAIVSGRPVAFLERFFSDPVIHLSGLYGLEQRAHGRLLVDSAALEWLPVMTRIADEARDRFGLEAVEDKRYSMTIHYRAMGDLAHEVHAWAGEAATRSGLVARAAKQSVELHPPTVRDKGLVVEELALGLAAAVYFGDDVGDLPAFVRLEALVAQGSLSASARVLVAGPETPDELRDHATDIIEGPRAVVAEIDQMLGCVADR